MPTDRPREKGTVVVDQDGRIIAFEEKAEHPRSNLSNGGVYEASRELFDDLRAAGPSDSLDFGYHVLPRMVGRMAAYPVREFLMDVGTLEAHSQAQAAWRDPAGFLT